MAQIATVFSCDNCPAVICIRSDEEWDKFEAEWADGILHQYCPKCKNLPDVVRAIKKEEQEVSQINEEFLRTEAAR